MLERGTTVEADTGEAGDRELDYQHVALLAGWVVAWGTVDGTHRAAGKGLGIEAGSRRPCRTIDKSCSWSLPILSLPLASLRTRIVELGWRSRRPGARLRRSLVLALVGALGCVCIRINVLVRDCASGLLQLRLGLVRYFEGRVRSRCLDHPHPGFLRPMGSPIHSLASPPTGAGDAPLKTCLRARI
jgi:hypothetical protein